MDGSIGDEEDRASSTTTMASSRRSSTGCDQQCHGCLKIVRKGKKIASCFLCQQPDGRGCYNGVRSKHRALFSSFGKQAVLEDKQKMAAHPAEWRAESSPFWESVGFDGKRQAALDAIRKKRTVEEYSEFENTQGNVKKKWFNKRHFKKFKSFWDDMDSDDASEEFAKLLVEQSSQDGEVWVAKGRTEVTSSGTRNSWADQVVCVFAEIVGFQF